MGDDDLFMLIKNSIPNPYVVFLLWCEGGERESQFQVKPVRRRARQVTCISELEIEIQPPHLCMIVDPPVYRPLAS